MLLNSVRTHEVELIMRFIYFYSEMKPGGETIMYGLRMVSFFILVF